MDEKVDVVIPALNEPGLNNLLSRLKQHNVIVRSDRGLSLAVWKGLQQAEEEVCVVMDADGSHPPEAIEPMKRLLDSKVWLVVGSRYCHGGYSYDSFSRKIMSLTYCFLARVVLRSRIKDCMSGFWVGFREAFRFEPSSDFKFGLQLIRNVGDEHIMEFPIVFEKRREGKSHVKPLQALRDLISIIKVYV